MNERKAVFFDIDGTLITKNGGPFQEDTEVMAEAAEKGHFLFLNSGRSFANIPQALLEFSFIKGIAAGGGSHVLLRSPDEDLRYQTIYHQWLSEETLTKIFAWYAKQPFPCTLEGERACYIINQPSRLPTVKAPVFVDSLDDFKRKRDGDHITKLTLDGFASEDELLLLEPFFRVNRFVDYSEAIIKGDTKGKAIDLILNKFGIERENSIAIGDGANDLDMFRSTGLGIAMGNAAAELKAAAGIITGDCGKGGVAEALKRFVL